MKYVSKNELNTLRFDDCILKKMEINEENMKLLVEALIILSGNSQNTNYTDSYAGEAVIEISNARLTKVIKEGYKRYDANDVLMEEIPDTVMDTDADYPGLFKEQYLISLKEAESPKDDSQKDDSQKDGRYLTFEVEMTDEDPSVITDVYEMTVEYSDVTVSWDRYLNRVQY